MASNNFTNQDIQRFIAILRRHTIGTGSQRVPGAIAREMGIRVDWDSLRKVISHRTGKPVSAYMIDPRRIAPRAVEPPPEEVLEFGLEDEAPAPEEALPTPERAGAVQRLLKIVRGGPVSLEELCDRLELSPAKVRALIDEAQSQGFSVDLEHDFVGNRPPPNPLDELAITVPDPVADRYIFALVGDVHIGSKHFLEGPFLDFYQEAYERGVRRFLCVGDLLDGVYGFSLYEQRERGFEEQCARAIDVIPRYPGAEFLWILGNHDETFETKSGLSVLRASNDMFRAAGRTDVTCVGARGKYLHLQKQPDQRGIVVELWHPAGKPAYALSYKMQNHIRDYPVGHKPDVLAVGHWHQQCHFANRGVYAFSCGCWQGGGSSYGRALGGAPAVGSWIVEARVTAGGTIREINPAWRAYYEREEPRPVAMGPGVEQ